VIIIRADSGINDIDSSKEQRRKRRRWRENARRDFDGGHSSPRFRIRTREKATRRCRRKGRKGSGAFRPCLFGRRGPERHFFSPREEYDDGDGAVEHVSEFPGNVRAEAAVFVEPLKF